MKKAARFLILLLVCILILPSCGESIDNNTTVETTEYIDPSILEIVSPNQVFRVIRGEKADDSEAVAATRLRKALAAKYPEYTIEIDTDFLVDNRQDETIDYPGFEILVGRTNRRESRETDGTIENDEFVIKVVNDKLVIMGGTVFGTEDAVEFFIENYIDPADSSALVLKKDFIDVQIRERTSPALYTGTTLRYLSWNLGGHVGVPEDCLTVLNRYEPDLIGAQECPPTVHDDILDAYCKQHKNMKVVQRKHDGGNPTLYTPIVYNSELMKLVNHGSIWLRGRYTGTDTKSIGWAVFEMDGQKFAVMNFHGAVCSANYTGWKDKTSQQRSAQAEAWRYDNAVQLTEFKQTLYKKYGEMPVIISGDCNFNSNSAPFAVLIQDGFKDAEQTAKKVKKKNLTTCFTYGNPLPTSGMTIDHIFGCNGVFFGYYDIITDKEVKTASDHMPIYADLTPFGN